MAKIIVQRTSEYNNMFRNYVIYIDNKKAGTIANGKMMEFDTTPGRHILRANIDWGSSPDLVVDVDDDRPLKVKVGGYRRGRWIIPASIGVILLHFILKQTGIFDYLIFLLIPAFALMLYYVTFGRKEYLSLVKI